MAVIGILHPGKMGSTVGRVLKEKGHIIVWASEDRSDETRERADGFSDLRKIKEVAKEADVIFSICQQAGVVPNFAEVESNGFKGIYVDANFIDEKSASMSKRDTFSECAKAAGFDYVDGAIYGYPIPGPPDCTTERTFYLSGEKADVIAELFEDTSFEGMKCEDAKKERTERMNDEYQGFYHWFRNLDLSAGTPDDYEETKVFKGDSDGTS
jgi:3-hydroxyisobutyrate dehydrogenase-like beta-hydroxyacid dehydrogenase